MPATPQLVPQAPQLAASRENEASQPSALFPLQLPKPVAQVMPQPVRMLHVGVAFAPGAHTRPQALQLLVVVSETSQPSAALALQFPKPRRHESPHTPAEHDAVELGPLAHARAHIPQLARSVCRFTSQPFAGLRSQSAKPALHVAIAHAPAAQLAVALGSEHTRPHIPQLLTLVVTSTHVPPQRMAGALQPEVQRRMSASQMGVAPVQAVPHAPQFMAVSSVASQPLAVARSQSAKFVLHAKVQLEAAHETAALARAGHALPHDPQCAVDVRVSTQDPLQRVCPRGHEGPLSTAASGGDGTSGAPASGRGPPLSGTVESRGAATSMGALVSGGAIEVSGTTRSASSASIVEPASCDASRSRMGTLVHAAPTTLTARHRDRGRRSEGMDMRVSSVP